MASILGRHSIERFEGAIFIVSFPNPVHEGNFVTQGAYFGGEGQPL